MDKDRVKKLVRELIIELGEDPTREGLKDTPRRIADAYGEIFSGYDSDSELSVQFSEDSEGQANYSLGSPAPLYDEAVRIFQTKKPIVAAIHGAAVGGGLGLALTADFRIGCSESRFVANFTKLGFHPGFGLTVTLPALIGKNNAELMFYTSRRIKGEKALEIGLLNELVPQSSVFQTSMNLASEIAECSPLGLLSTRATVRGDLADRIRRATKLELKEQTWLRETEDFAEGVKAVAERRAARFSGK